MIKSTKMLKRLGANFLVVLMSIESFAAVVGDNDGAAFITKAEFDSMKNDFQSQLDRYNSSLDNKIDGAIASYLSGISIPKVVDVDCLIKNLNAVYRTFKKAEWNNYNSTDTVAVNEWVQIQYVKGAWQMDANPSVGEYNGIEWMRVMQTTPRGNWTTSTFGWWTPVKKNDTLNYYYVSNNYQKREVMYYRALGGNVQYTNMLPNDTLDPSLDTTEEIFDGRLTNKDIVASQWEKQLVGTDAKYNRSLVNQLTDGTADDNKCDNLTCPAFNVISNDEHWFLDMDNTEVFTNDVGFEGSIGLDRINVNSYKKHSTTQKITTAIANIPINTSNLKFKINSTKKIKIKISDLYNDTLSRLINKPVRLYNGIPFCKALKRTGKLKFDLNITKDAVVCVKYGGFKNEVVTTSYTDCVKNFGTLTAGEHKGLEIELDDSIWRTRDEEFFIKVNPASDTDTPCITIDNITFTEDA
ncbi:MAG: hypothetical protein J6O09_01520 [Lachnospiraceae bacterium]|nr:hypothetical protein [Lachnospiraceae bacterium]